MIEITDIYSQYRIMPTLQQHQLRVAGVAKVITDNLTVRVDQPAVVKACLLHDMGNILKFDLGKFPDFLEPEGLDYWQEVKDSYQAKYGDDEHQATLTIAQELGMSEFVLELIDAIGFQQAQVNATSNQIERKVCAYADMRVDPFGVVSLDERLSDLRDRYSLHYPTEQDQMHRNAFEKQLRDIQDQLQQVATIDLTQIDNQTIEAELSTLCDCDFELAGNVIK